MHSRASCQALNHTRQHLKNFTSLDFHRFWTFFTHWRLLCFCACLIFTSTVFHSFFAWFSFSTFHALPDCCACLWFFCLFIQAHGYHTAEAGKIWTFTCIESQLKNDAMKEKCVVVGSTAAADTAADKPTTTTRMEPEQCAREGKERSEFGKHDNSDICSQACSEKQPSIFFYLSSICLLDHRLLLFFSLLLFFLHSFPRCFACLFVVCSTAYFKNTPTNSIMHEIQFDHCVQRLDQHIKSEVQTLTNAIAKTHISRE